MEHGLPDEWAPHAAKLALESRAFPLLVYDPDAGESLAEQLSLDGNPAVEDRWPTYALEYVDDDGQPARMELPVTIADWAATEGRFKKHFHPLKSDDADEALIAFHELLELPEEEREGRRPFIYALDREKKLTRLAVSGEMVALAEERLRHWGLLREMAGLQVPDAVRDRVSAQMEAEFDARMEALRAEHEQKLAELRATYPVVIARRLAEGLIRSGNGTRTVADLLASAGAEAPAANVIPLDPAAISALAAPPAAPPAPTHSPAPPAAAAPAAAMAGSPSPSAAAVLVEAEEEADEAMAMEPYIETARCTTCNECTNLNGRMFAYNADRQAYVKDARMGTYAQLVQAALLRSREFVDFTLPKRIAAPPSARHRPDAAAAELLPRRAVAAALSVWDRPGFLWLVLDPWGADIGDAGLAAAGAHHRDAGGALRRRLVAQPARGPVDHAGAVRRGAAGTGRRAGAAGVGQDAVVRAAGAGALNIVGVGRMA